MAADPAIHGKVDDLFARFRPGEFQVPITDKSLAGAAGDRDTELPSDPVIALAESAQVLLDLEVEIARPFARVAAREQYQFIGDRLPGPVYVFNQSSPLPGQQAEEGGQNDLPGRQLVIRSRSRLHKDRPGIFHPFADDRDRRHFFPAVEIFACQNGHGQMRPLVDEAEGSVICPRTGIGLFELSL